MTPAQTSTPREDDDTVAVVLSGAAARGAFQAGALAVLIPYLHSEGLRPTIWLGTSAGSINAALWCAAPPEEPPQDTASRVERLWSSMNDDNVYQPLLSLSTLGTGRRYLAGVAGLGPGVTSLLRTEPLHRTAQHELDMEQLADNVQGGRFAAVGIVGTRMPAVKDVPPAASGRSVLFLHERRKGRYVGDPDRALDVARGQLQTDHVLASSAIPVAFPPVKVTAPADAEGWYVDGGVRLNTPLHPAVHLGATKIVLISATATTYCRRPGSDSTGGTKHVADSAAQVLNAVLGDRTTEDLGALRRMNRLLDGVPAGTRLEDRSGRSYRQVKVLPVSPPPGAMGRIAARAFARQTRGFRRLTEIDNWLLDRVIRGTGDSYGRQELLSYLFFDEDYFKSSLNLGRRAAQLALRHGWLL